MFFEEEKIYRLKSILYSQTYLNIAFFCARLLKGYGVDLVVATQAKYLASWGHKVRIYTIANDNFFKESFAQIGNIKVIQLSTKDLMNALPKITCDVAIAHTDPFFELVLKLNAYVTKIAWDYGEPPPELFPEQLEQRKAQKEFRRLNHHLYHKTIAISKFVKEDMGLDLADVVYCGSDHLVAEYPHYYKFKDKIKQKLIFRGYSPEVLNQPFLLCVSRLGEIYRRYKGTDDLHELSKLTGLPVMLVGKSDYPNDVEYFQHQGLICLDNLSNEELISAYLNCAACVSLSKWEGYNLPLVEAMTFGRMSFALDRGAHRETGAFVTADLEDLLKLLKENINKNFRLVRPKTLYSWKDNAQILNSIIYETRLKHLSMILGDNSKKMIIPFLKTITLPRIRNIQKEISFGVLYPERQKAKQLSILILSKNNIHLLKPCIETLRKTLAGIDHEILIADTGSEKPETELYYKSIPEQVFYLGKYNFSDSNNYLANLAHGKYLLLLNNDTEAILPSVEKMIQILEDSPQKVGAVGAKLLYPNFRIQHAGVYICNKEPYKYIPEHLYRNCKSSEPDVIHSKIVPAITGACLLTPKEVFLEAGGLDTIYEEECQDIDYCFRLKKYQGLSSYYCSDSAWIHKEGCTRTVTENLRDRKTFIDRWKTFIDVNFFNYD